jgi:hypothetical protein
MQKLALLLAALALPLPAAAQHRGGGAPATAAVKQGVEKGFRTCAEPLETAVKYVHDTDESYAFFGTWSQRAPDDEAYNAVTSQAYDDAHTLASLTGVKAASGKCNVILTQATVVPAKSCQELRKESFAEWKFYVTLKGVDAYEDPTSSDVTVLLLPTGKTGCLVLKQAVLYGP